MATEALSLSLRVSSRGSIKMLMKIMGGKKPDALFSRSGDSDTPLPLLAPYLKKIMTTLMLLCFWQHINIIMRSIRPRRSAALALSPFLSFIFIIILADVGSLKRVKG